VIAETPPRRVVNGPSATRQARPHGYEGDPDVPGTCRCHLVKAHRLHDPDVVAAFEADQGAIAAEERRRFGEAD